ncbi:MAG: DUF2325 domain-containing protein [Anaerovoracaceae bacterium]|jgi:hypothetical protein
MSVVIIGGNECMERRYKEICKNYNCKAKVFAKFSQGMQQKIGSPDMMVLFTSTVSHKMIKCALNKVKGTGTLVVRSHSSSKNALENIMEEHTS